MDNLFEGTWAIVNTTNNRSYIGRLTNKPLLEYFKEQINKSTLDWVTIDPAFDWIVGQQLGPNGLTKIPAITPVDMLQNNCAVNVRVSGIIFFDDMQEEDRARYKEMVGKVIDQMKQEKRARSTGLRLVKSLDEDIPPKLKR